MSEPVCPCDVRVFPPPLDIAAGLPNLPRQIGGFPEFRAALLAALDQAALRYPALASLRAQDEHDFGRMLIEMWAYVADIVAFYDAAHANESYLRTAVLPASLRRLVGLIGYLPRPELASLVSLALQAEGRRPLDLPPGVAFRSAAFGAEPPQVFETGAAATVDPRANRWSVAPPRATTLSGKIDHLLLDPASARVARDDRLWLELGGGAWTRVAILQAAKVSKVTLDDGGHYARVDLAEPLSLTEPREIAQARLMKPTQRTGLWTRRDPADPQVADDYGGDDWLAAGTRLLLNGLLRRFEPGDRLLLEVPGDHQAVHVASTDEPLVTVVSAQTIKVGDDDVTTPATKVATTRLWTDFPVPDPRDFAASDNSDWTDPGKFVIRYGFVEAGQLVGAAATVLADSDPIALVGLRASPEGAPDVAEVLLASADERGLDSKASLDFAASTLKLDSTTHWTPPLELPVSVYGNVVAATRGETVAAEVLGGGDATQARQFFTLQKKPLTYVPSASADNDWGAVSTLRIWVDGLAWTEVRSLYGVGPADQVYIVRRRDDGASVVTFGSPLPTGVGNIVASYRFGGGAAAPPAFAIKQIARPVAGLKSVINPVAAAGGADAEPPQSVRTLAPKSALLLGRAVSTADFAAAAAAVGGVRLAVADWRWSAKRHRATVQVFYVGPPELARLVSQRLRALADPSTPIEVNQAAPLAATLAVDVATDPRRDTPTVLAAVAAALADPQNGLLQPERQGVGATLFRSAIFAAVLAVPGALAVRALRLDGEDFEPYGRNPGPGAYFDFAVGLTVSGSPDHG